MGSASGQRAANSIAAIVQIFMAASTLARVLGETGLELLMVNDTVANDTFAKLATSCMVATLLLPVALAQSYPTLPES
ncbi:hypothetical protein NHF46_23915 [Arthrobacter alpinus]|nr:hypothetical protein [Arthrobacter alpinus]